jgi:Homeodomain-like domain
MKKYVVRLEPQEREALEKLVRRGRVAAYKVRHANILLQADEAGVNWTDQRIGEGLGVSIRAIEQLRKRFVEEGLESCLERKKQERPSIEPMFDGEKEARLIALSCSQPPVGRARWSLALLADKAVELKIVQATSVETVRRVLQKTR